VETAASLPRRRFDPVAYLKLFRFPLVFTAIADSAAGYLLATSGRIEPGTLALLAVSSAGLYFFGMALNDIADRERDKQIAPGRVLPSGRLSLRAAQWAAMSVVLISLGANLALGSHFLIQRAVVWGIVVVSIVAYNCYLKYPPVMGLVRAFNLLLGVSSCVPIYGATIPTWVFMIVAFPTFLYISAVTYVSTLEDGALDRTRLFLGASLMALGALLAAVTLPIWSAVDAHAGATGPPDVHAILKRAIHSWEGFGFASLLTGWIIRRAWTAQDRKGIMLMVRDGIGGVIVLDASLVVSFADPFAAFCVAALVIPAILSVAVFKKLA
jgi:hypothetical protein